MTERKTLTVPELRTQSHVSFVQGCKGAIVGASVGVVASILSFRFSPAFRGLSRPQQYSMISSGSVAGYLFGSERAAFNYKNKTLGYVDHRTIDSRVLQNYRNLPREPRQQFFRFLNDHRWAILGTTWATSMVGVYGYSFHLTTRVSLKQKLFQARIYAQFVTLVALLASAAISFYVDESDKRLLKDIPESRLRAVLELPMSDHQQKHSMI
ncbi:MAG: hypothetical protein EXX96DRAFT_507565 [Benjaminiella poitrasii]|nr:MAG: hypothetical protein EXX96DRAFT_507565 [Benjaminiella poitrasii]